MWSRKQSKHSRIYEYEPYETLKNFYDPLKISEAAYLLLLLFTRKKKTFNAFSWAKNTARGVRFLLGFINRYLFLAQCEQVYLFSALAQNKILWCNPKRSDFISNQNSTPVGNTNRSSVCSRRGVANWCTKMKIDTLDFNIPGTTQTTASSSRHRLAYPT